MKPKIKALVVSLALLASSVHAGAAGQPRDDAERAADLVALATVASGPRAAAIRARTDGRSSPKTLSDSGSGNPLPEDGSSTRENLGSAAAREYSPARLSVPEPGKWAVVLAGLLGVGAIARRRMAT